MKHRLFATLAVVLSLGGIATAQATIIGASPNTNFSNSSVTFGFGNAQYTLFNNPEASNSLSVSTSGSAQVSLFGTPPNRPTSPGGVGGAGNHLPNFQGPLGEQSYSYGKFSDATPSPTFNFFGPYLGLKFKLDGDTHYGFAKVTGTDTLVNYAYNSVAGEGIVTGAAIEQEIGMGGNTAVPGPSSLAMLGLGLCFIVGVGLTRRRSISGSHISPEAI